MAWQWINQLTYIFTSTCFVKNANCSFVCQSYNLDYDDWFILIFSPQAEIHSTGIQNVLVLCFFLFIALQLYSLTINFLVRGAAHVDLFGPFTFPIDTLTRITAVPEKQNTHVAIIEIVLTV